MCTADQHESDETAYLLQSPANRARLLQALENVTQRRNLVTVEIRDECGMRVITSACKSDQGYMSPKLPDSGE